MKATRITIFLLLYVVAAGSAWAQESRVASDTSDGGRIIVINANRTEGNQKKAYSELFGNVIFRQDSIIVYADTVRLYRKQNRAIATGNVIIQRSDTSSAFCRELDYLGQESRAIMKGDAAIQHGRQKLFGQYLTYDLTSNIATYTTASTLTDGERQVASRRGRYFMDQSLVIFSDSVVLAGADYVMRTDSLHYFMNEDKAVMYRPFRVKQGERDIYAESGTYDLVTQSAELYGQAQFSEPGKRASADTMYFDGPTQDVILVGDARYAEGDRFISADKIDYGPSVDSAILTGQVYIRDADQTVEGERVVYRMSDQKVSADGRTTILREGQRLLADQIIDLDEGRRLAKGNVRWEDTTQRIQLVCPDVVFDENTEEVTAFGDALRLVKYIEGDSLVLTADTMLLAGGDSTSGRRLFAYHHVVGHKSDIQFVTDKLRYDEKTSMFRMHGDPKVWSDSTLMYADTILLSLVDNALSKVDLIDEAMLLKLRPYAFYDQVKGKIIIAKMKDDALDEVHVRGNAQSVYYAADESGGFVGVNEVDCSEMRLAMASGQVSRIRFYTEPTSTFHPMTAVDHMALRLQGFDADDVLRCRSADDIFRIYELMSNQ